MQGERRGVASTDAIRAAKSQQQGGTVPVIAVVPPEGLASEAEAASVAEADADGIAVPLDRLQQTAASFSGRTDREAQNPVSIYCRHPSMMHVLPVADGALIPTDDMQTWIIFQGPQVHALAASCRC